MTVFVIYSYKIISSYNVLPETTFKNKVSMMDCKDRLIVNFARMYLHVFVNLDCFFSVQYQKLKCICF